MNPASHTDMNRLWECFMTAPWGNCFDSYVTLHMNPIQICFGRCWINIKAVRLASLCKKNNNKTNQYVQQKADGVWNLAAFMCVSIYTSTLRWWMGPQVNESDILHLSIPLCHNESLCTDGKEASSLIPRNVSHSKTESKIHDVV